MNYKSRFLTDIMTSDFHRKTPTIKIHSDKNHFCTFVTRKSFNPFSSFFFISEILITNFSTAGYSNTNSNSFLQTWHLTNKSNHAATIFLLLYLCLREVKNIFYCLIIIILHANLWILVMHQIIKYII